MLRVRGSRTGCADAKVVITHFFFPPPIFLYVVVGLAPLEPAGFLGLRPRFFLMGGETTAALSPSALVVLSGDPPFSIFMVGSG